MELKNKIEEIIRQSMRGDIKVEEASFNILNLIEIKRIEFHK